jgi:hypothetical protein
MDMKQVQEEHICRDIHKAALALEKIAKALTSAEQGAPDINVANIGTISRQVAIDMLDEQIELCNASLHKGVPEKDAYAIKVERASLMAYREKLECLPFVQPERKMGHWILDISGRYCCNRCMEPCATYAMMKPRDKFCKMCGSRNEVME